MSVQLYQGDCLAELGRVADHSVHLIAADLPYGTTQARWDVVIPFAPLWAQFTRILAPRGVVVLTAAQPFTSLCVLSNPAWFRYDWVWRKSRGSGHLNSKRRPLQVHESVLIFSPRQSVYNPQMTPRAVPYIHKGHTKIYGTDGQSTYGKRIGCTPAVHTARYPVSVLDFPSSEQGSKRHPNEKPLDLLEYIVKTYSNPGDVVCDPTMGSGTTGEAAVNLGRTFIGCELDPGYFTIAQERIAAAVTRAHQLPLEVPA